jgi:hypothetical protein
MHYTIVFDLDGLVVTAPGKYDQDKVRAMAIEVLGEQWIESLSTTACDYLHLVYPGFYEIFRWLHQLEHEIVFFSSGAEIRNTELVPKLIQRAFGQQAEEVLPNVRIFSGEHCLDTSKYVYMDRQKEYQPQKWFGNLKKVMRDVVVPEERIPYTLLVEDDPSYMAKGEENNMIVLPCTSIYPYAKVMDKFVWRSFHKAYLLCGLLDTIFRTAADRDIPLTAASAHVHGKSVDDAFTWDTFQKMWDELSCYDQGLAILRKYDPNLKYFLEMRQEQAK